MLITKTLNEDYRKLRGVTSRGGRIKIKNTFITHYKDYVKNEMDEAEIIQWEVEIIQCKYFGSVELKIKF